MRIVPMHILEKRKESQAAENQLDKHALDDSRTGGSVEGNSK